MTHFKIVAVSLVVALPLACSKDRRDTQSPEEFTPASGYEEEPPAYEQAPQQQQAPSQSPGAAPQHEPMSPSAPDESDPDRMHDPAGSDMDAPDTMGTGGTSGNWRNTGGTTTGGTGTGGNGTGGNGANTGM